MDQSRDAPAVGGLAEYERAYALAPNNGTVMNFLAGGYLTLGQLQPAAELRRKAIATDPLRPDFYANLVSVLLPLGQLDAAEQATRKALALHPGYPGLYSSLAMIHILRGEADEAMREAGQETDPVYGPWIRAAAQQVNPDRRQADAALHAYIAENGKSQPFGVAELYAARKEPDAMFEWLQRARQQHDSLMTYSLLSDPLVLPYRHDPRFAALCEQIGLPLPVTQAQS